MILDLSNPVLDNDRTMTLNYFKSRLNITNEEAEKLEMQLIRDAQGERSAYFQLFVSRHCKRM